MEQKTRFATSDPKSPLLGVGGVNIVREKLPTRSAGSSLVFRSKTKQSKWAAFCYLCVPKNVSYNNIVSSHLNPCLGIVARRRKAADWSQRVASSGAMSASEEPIVLSSTKARVAGAAGRR